MNYDAIVIGGGPAGSTAAALLAEKGRRVRPAGKGKVPALSHRRIADAVRLLHAGAPRRARQDEGVAFHEKVQRAVRQPGSGERRCRSISSQHLTHEAAQTWQVLRSEFDQMLLDNAREKGAEVREETTVREGIWENGGVVGVKAFPKTARCRNSARPITIDATGRDTFFVTRSGWKIRDPYLNKIAVWTYYKGAKRDPGMTKARRPSPMCRKRAGSGTSRWPTTSSAWASSRKRITSIKTRRTSRRFSNSEVERNAWIKDHLAVGEQSGPYRVTGEYSYRSRHCASQGSGSRGRRLRVSRSGLLLGRLPRALLAANWEPTSPTPR